MSIRQRTLLDKDMVCERRRWIRGRCLIRDAGARTSASASFVIRGVAHYARLLGAMEMWLQGLRLHWRQIVPFSSILIVP